MEKQSKYKEYSSIEEYIEDHVGEMIDAGGFQSVMAMGLRRVDEQRRKTFRVKSCPANHFEKCRLDDCALFENDKPGLPWWGVCRLGRWPVEG